MKVYRSRDISKINFRDYISELVSNLQLTYNIRPNQINFICEVDKIELGIDTAIPCSLMINELISNSFKHAFNGLDKGTVKIRMRPVSDNEYELSVSDNGKGIPADIDLEYGIAGAPACCYTG